MLIRTAFLAAMLILAAAASIAASYESIRGLVVWGVVSNNCGLTLAIRATTVSVLDPPCTLAGLASVEGVYVLNGTVYIETSEGVVRLDPSTCKASIVSTVPRGACRARANETGLPLYNGLADYTFIRLASATLRLPVDATWYCVDQEHAVILRKLEGKVVLYNAEGSAYRVAGEASAALALGVLWERWAYALGFTPLYASTMIAQLIRPGNATILGVYQGMLLNATSGDTLLPILVVTDAKRRIAEQRLYELRDGALRSVKLAVVRTLPEPAGFGTCDSRVAIWFTATKLLATIGAELNVSSPRSEPIGVTSGCEPVVKLGSSTILYPHVGLVTTPLPVERGLASLDGLLVLAAGNATIVYKPGSEPLIYNRGASAAAVLLYPWGLALNGLAVDREGRAYPAEISTCIVHGWTAIAKQHGNSTLVLALGPQGPRCATLPLKLYMVRGLVHDGRHAWLLAVLEQPSGGHVLTAIRLDQLPSCKPLHPAEKTSKTRGGTTEAGPTTATSSGGANGNQAGARAGTHTTRTTGMRSTKPGTPATPAGTEAVTSTVTPSGVATQEKPGTRTARTSTPSETGGGMLPPLALIAAALAALLVFLARRRS